MNFSLSEEQEMLRDMLTRFLREAYPFEARRERVAAGGGEDRALWRSLAELGILGATLPEGAGGLGGGAVETMVVMEALGEALVAEPYLETVAIAGSLLAACGGDGAAALLASIGSGEARVVLAHCETADRHDPERVETRAVAQGDGWRIDGRKAVVVGAGNADRLIVSARHGAGLALFLIDPGAAGVTLHRYRLIDERPAADVELAGVRVGGDAMLHAGDAAPIVAAALDAGLAALCAEAVGVLRRMLDDSVAYAKDRRQFGQALAQFQVLQHRMVDMFLMLEQAVSACHLATLNLNAPPGQRARALAAAKATIGLAARRIGEDAVQLHGAMGMTEELAVGHYFKRAAAIARQFGTVDDHVRRYAALTRAA